jgi:hypothetical protein
VQPTIFEAHDLVPTVSVLIWFFEKLLYKMKIHTKEASAGSWPKHILKAARA